MGGEGLPAGSQWQRTEPGPLEQPPPTQNTEVQNVMLICPLVTSKDIRRPLPAARPNKHVQKYLRQAKKTDVKERPGSRDDHPKPFRATDGKQLVLFMVEPNPNTEPPHVTDFQTHANSDFKDQH